MAVSELTLAAKPVVIPTPSTETEEKSELQQLADYYISRGIYNRYVFAAYPPYVLTDLPLPHLKIHRTAEEMDPIKKETNWIRYNFHI